MNLSKIIQRDNDLRNRICLPINIVGPAPILYLEHKFILASSDYYMGLR